MLGEVGTVVNSHGHGRQQERLVGVVASGRSWGALSTTAAPARLPESAS